MSTNNDCDVISLKIPYGHQQKAINLLEKYDCVLQFGARGSGKSETIDQVGIWQSLRYKGNSGIVVRRKQDDAKGDDYDHFLKACPKELIIDKGNEGQAKYLKIRPADWSGDESELSKVLFIGCISEGRQNPDSVKGEFGWVAFPELSEIEENVFQQADTSCRMPGTGRKIICASNRVPKQHWIWSHFGLVEIIEDEDFYIDPSTGFLAKSGELRHVYAGPYPMKVAITSKTTDNHGLDPDYVEKKFGNMPAAWIAKYIEGKSGFEPDGRGVYEKDFRSDIHIVPIDIAEGIEIIRAFDADLHPGILWGQFVQGDNGLMEYHALAEITGYGVRYDNFLVEAFKLQNDLFGNGCRYLNCGDPALRTENAQTKRAYLNVLEDHGITDVKLADDPVRNSKVHRVMICQSWLKVDGSYSRVKIHPRCEVLIEGCEGGYKNRWNQTVSKMVQEPVKDPFYSAVQDCWQYSLTNFADIHGGVHMPTVFAPKKYPPKAVPMANMAQRGIREQVRKGLLRG